MGSFPETQVDRNSSPIKVFVHREVDSIFHLLLSYFEGEWRI